MAPQSAKPRAGCVHEYSVERAIGPVRPVSCERSCIELQRSNDRDSKRGCTSIYLGEPVPVSVQGNDLSAVLHQLSKVGCLPAGCSAGVENPLPRLGREEVPYQLGSLALYGAPCLGNGAQVTCLVWSPDGRTLIGGCENGELAVIRTQEGRCQRKNGGVRSLRRTCLR